MENKNIEFKQRFRLVFKPGIYYVLSFLVVFLFILSCSLYHSFFAKEIHGLTWDWVYGHDIIDSLLNMGFVLSFINLINAIKKERDKYDCRESH
jgi:hypothetical protein